MRVYRIAKIIQHVSKLIFLKNKRITKHRFNYENIPYILLIRVNQLKNLREQLINLLFKEILLQEYNPRENVNVWIRL